MKYFFGANTIFERPPIQYVLLQDLIPPRQLPGEFCEFRFYQPGHKAMNSIKLMVMIGGRIRDVKTLAYSTASSLNGSNCFVIMVMTGKFIRSGVSNNML